MHFRIDPGDNRIELGKENEIFSFRQKLLPLLVKEGDPEAYRAVVLEPPDGFSREIEGLKALTFSIVSYKKVYDKIGKRG